MQILEYGDLNKDKIILIHGFQMHLDSMKTYINVLKKDYCVIVPILPAHNPDIKEEFESFNKCLKEFEQYYISKFGNIAFAIISFSMGGVFGSYIWKNSRIKINKIIIESSPLLKWSNFTISIMTKFYLSLTDAARKRNKRIINKAIKSIVLEENLDSFLAILDNMSNDTIIKYLKEVGKFNLPNNIDSTNTKIHYYGGKINEIIFKKVAKYITKHYKNSYIHFIKGKGHCEDVIFDSKKKVKELINLLNT